MDCEFTRYVFEGKHIANGGIFDEFLFHGQENMGTKIVALGVKHQTNMINSNKIDIVKQHETRHQHHMQKLDQTTHIINVFHKSLSNPSSNTVR